MITTLELGAMVQAVSDPARTGTVVGLGPLHAGVQYYVVFWGDGSGRSTVSELDLRRYAEPASPSANLIGNQTTGYSEFLRLMTYQRLSRDRPLRNNFHAYNAARIQFLPTADR